MASGKRMQWRLERALERNGFFKAQFWIPCSTTTVNLSPPLSSGVRRVLMSGIYRANTIRDLIEAGFDDAPAIGAPGRTSLSYGDLRDLAETTMADLNRMNVGRNDRVAIVLPNGPEMAAAFIAIGCGATTAPLNHAYRAEEFDFYLSDLSAKALVILEGMESPALAIARARNIPILTLKPGNKAGDFTLHGDVAAGNCDGGFAGQDDIALVLHTSGTTSRPKIVPLSQTNVTASAYHIGHTLALREDDVCLNVMPLFHIHGLIAATLSSIGAGASVVCTPGFNALKFFGWMEDARPTWYTAVPTMHQAILTRAERNAGIIRNGRLRLIRSSSSSLPPQVMEALEATFEVPVIEAYGMTEASHQMASNPLPPKARFAGSVGLAAGPDVAIMDDAGTLLAPGALGEVVIRGRNVTKGYESNPDANAKAFTDGWFRTGDQGVMDADGYLRLTGRLKELINRGGEKISPLEVDTVIMDHPAVAQVVTFAMPHDMLGEEIAAAVVLREGAACDERELRTFVSSRVADFKVPRKIVFLAEIPKGATGKLQRIGLAEKLGLAK
jgi:oxalate---CoA ligase